MKIERAAFYSWVEDRLLYELKQIKSEAVSALKLTYTHVESHPCLVIQATETQAIIRIWQTNDEWDAIKIAITRVAKTWTTRQAFFFRVPTLSLPAWGTHHLAKWLVIVAEHITRDDTDEVFMSKMRELVELTENESPVAAQFGEFDHFDNREQYV
jgi:hypothetical protein